jgi:phosphonate transport system substrate-binding protein
MKNAWISCISLMALLLMNCTNQGQRDGLVYPKVLHYGVSTLEEDPDIAFRRHEPLQRYIEGKAGVKMKIHSTTGYSSIIEALKSKKIDMCSMGSFAYIIASDKAHVEAIACLGTIEGKLRDYNSLIITHINSQLKTMDDVRMNAGELTIAYSDPASTSGHLIPKSYLKSFGMAPDRSFKEEVFATSHGAVILTTQSQKVDIGCCSFSSFRRLCHQKKIDPSEYRVLWKSEPIIYGAICVRKDLHPVLKEKLQKAITQFRFDDPDGWLQYASRIQMSSELPVDSLAYVAVHDSMYDPLRIISNQFGIYKFLN